MLPFKLVYSDAYYLPIGNHVFPAEKYRRIRDRLIATSVADTSYFLEPQPATDQDILLVHKPEYVQKLTTGTLSPRDQNTVLVLAGAGIRPGAPDLPAAVIDLAPTVLALLDLPPLPDADGRPLSESFTDGPAPETVAVETEEVAVVASGSLRRHRIGQTTYLDTGL